MLFMLIVPGAVWATAMAQTPSQGTESRRKREKDKGGS
jgi:hypothetical protein